MRSFYTEIKANGTRLSLILLALMAAGMVAWQLAGTDWVDDWNYKLMPDSHEGFWYMQGCEIKSWGDAFEAIIRHHLYTTPRLPNYLHTLSNLIPSRITRSLNGLMLAAAFFAIAVSIGGKRIFNSTGLVAVTWLSAWVILPLHDHFISSDFAFNYFWTTPLILLYLYLFMRECPLPRWLAWMPWAVAAVTGMMHEGATLPVAAGCALYIATHPKHLRNRRIALLVVMTVTALVFFFNSGMMERIDQHVTSRDNTYLPWMAINVIIESYGLPLAIASLIIARLKGQREGFKRFAKDNIILLMALAGAAAIAAVTMLRGRALWFADLFGLILFFKSIWMFFPWCRRTQPVMAALCGCALLFSIGWSASLQRRLSVESVEIEREATESGQPIAFIDYMEPNALFWWCLGIPQSITDSYANSSLAMYTCRNGEVSSAPYIIMLPENLKSQQPESWAKTPGNTGLSGRYPFLAGRKRLTDGTALTLTFGESSVANPINYLVNMVRQADSPITYPVEEWSIKYLGDTLWCYHIGRIRRLDRNREILSIDTIAAQ